MEGSEVGDLAREIGDLAPVGPKGESEIGDLAPVGLEEEIEIGDLAPVRVVMLVGTILDALLPSPWEPLDSS